MLFGSRRRSDGRRFLLLLAVGILLHAVPAEAESIRLAWDPSPTPGVIGYRVHVGTASREYTEVYDVGQRTGFIYEGSSGRRYYFAVSSYLPGPVEGPLSEEVSGYATEPSPPGRVRDYMLGGTAADTDPASPSRRLVCTELPDPDCFDVIPLIGSGHEITSLAALPDGRVLFIEDGRRVRVVARERPPPEPALDSGPAAVIVHAAVDPDFPVSGLVFVGIVEPSGGGRTALRIVRLRMVQDRLGEAATIVTGLPLGSHEHVPFTIDGDGHFYVALPAADHSIGSTGTVLRFNVDGTVPRDNPTTSPVLAYGYARPVAIEWDARTGRLWLSGSGGFPAPIVYLEMGAPPESHEWPRFPRPAYVERTGGMTNGPTAMEVALQRPVPEGEAIRLLLLDADGNVSQQTSDADSRSVFGYLGLNGLGAPLAVAAGADGRVYIALRHAAPDAFSIVQLRLRR